MVLTETDSVLPSHSQNTTKFCTLYFDTAHTKPLYTQIQLNCYWGEGGFAFNMTFCGWTQRFCPFFFFPFLC